MDTVAEMLAETERLPEESLDAQAVRLRMRASCTDAGRHHAQQQGHAQQDV